MVEGHRDVRTQLPLDLHGTLRRERTAGSIDVALEFHAVLGDAAKSLEREHLKATRVGEHRPVPGCEPVQATHLLDHRFSRPEVQVVGVAEDYLGPGAAYVVGTETPHDSMGAYRHEGGGLHLAVGKGERAGASQAIGALNLEFKHQI
jgi:hypothetical protein